MTTEQFYVLALIPLMGILLNGALFIYLGGRVDRLAEHMNRLAKEIAEVRADVAVVKDRLGIPAGGQRP